MKKITLICVAVFSCLVFSACGGTPKCDDEKVVENVKFTLAYVVANIVELERVAERGGAFTPEHILKEWAKNSIEVKLDNFGTADSPDICKANASISSTEFKAKDSGVIYYKANRNKDKENGIEIHFVKTEFKRFDMSDYNDLLNGEY